MNHTEATIRAILRQARGRVLMSTALFGLCWWLAISLGIWLTLFLLDNMLRLPPGLRLPLTLAGIILTGAGLLKKILVPATHPPTLERVAVELEKRYTVPDNLVINALQFEGQTLAPEEQWFADTTVTLSKNAIRRVALSDLWERQRLYRWGSLALIVVLLWAIYLFLFPHYVVNAWARFAMPLGDVPPTGSVTLKLTPASDVVISEGNSLPVIVEVIGVPLAGPPQIVWKEKVRAIDPVASGNDHAPMSDAPSGKGGYLYTFMDARRPFAFRVVAADTYTRSIYVAISPLPRIRESLFHVTPPAYTGLGSTNMPGPPCSVSCLSGTVLRTSLDIVPAVRSLWWKEPDKSIAFKPVNRRMEAETVMAAAGAYEVEALDPMSSQKCVLARGSFSLATDRPPEVEFLTDNLNRFVAPGTPLTLELQATDDFGVSNLAVTVTTPDAGQSERVLKTWTYLGPPGSRGPVKERLTLELNPAEFLPGAVYCLTASAGDFRPNSAPGTSKPLVLRIKTVADLALPPGDSLENALVMLKRTIAAQEKAKGVTENLNLHLEEATDRQTLPAHQKTMADRQEEARREGTLALNAFKQHKEGSAYVSRLETLINNEMPWVLADIASITRKTPETLPAAMDAIEQRQTLILMELIKLLGHVAERKPELTPPKADTGREEPPVVQPEMAGEELKDDLAEFTRRQKRIIEQSRTLSDRGPQDLTDEEQKILGALAREEAKWAAFFEEKLTDFSKLPLQDFADGSIAKELNEVIQEVKLAAQSLYDKAVELAVPHEQSGLENAEELIHNLERWIVDKPDRLKWLMEEPLAPADIALAELPSELEDIVGQLIDKEEAMTDEVEDVSSSWLDSLDKGAGWDAMDGPISVMSAKGITGNLLPNQQEIGGRSGEGRTGRSHGQMVEETAAGKGGRNTPSRLTPSPFEQGSIKDTSREEPGGATGGGKLAGAAGEGLRGPVPPPLLQKMGRLAGQQSAIRQEAETVALKLRAYHLPTGDLEGSILEMKSLETAAKQGYGLGVRQSFSRIMDALQESKRNIRTETGLRREQTRLPEWIRNEIMTGLEDGIPKGYEEMVSAYYRALAEIK